MNNSENPMDWIVVYSREREREEAGRHNCQWKNIGGERQKMIHRLKKWIQKGKILEDLQKHNCVVIIIENKLSKAQSQLY